MSDPSTSISRRAFAATAFTIVPRHVLGGQARPAPSDRVNIASIGMGRQGLAVTMELMARPDTQIVAVCDCNRKAFNYAEYGTNALLTAARRLLGPGNEKWGEDLTSPGSAQLTNNFKTSLGMGGREPAQRIVEAYYAGKAGSSTYKGCGSYADYRELLEKARDVDAVYIATPDHWHAPISMAALRKKKHVLCQKPMTHSIGEARRVAALAREMKVAASLPVNNPSTENTRLIKSWIDDGAIGKVRAVHNWSGRPYWPQGVPRPATSEPAPAGLDWDMWLGPAPARPFHSIYQPFSWRGWYDFGCGSFGDMGCYSFAGIFKILGLAPPTAVEASSSEYFEETYPKASIVHHDFGDLRLSWYDGGIKPARIKGLRREDQALFAARGEGILYVGDKGLILAGFNGQSPRVYPENPNYRTPAPPPRGGGEGGQRDHAIDQWLAACKGGPAPLASFESQAPVTEAFLLGCMAQRMVGERLEWDTAAMKVKNVARANQYVDPPYRGQYGS
jgi:predicted dehydrogenase